MGKTRKKITFRLVEKSLAVQLLFVFSRYMYFTFSIITQLGIFALKSY